MKISHIFSFALSLLLLAGCGTEKTGSHCKRVLMIGNSFSISLMSNMPKVAKALDIPLDLTSLFIGGCSLERHMENARRNGEENFLPYDVNCSVDGVAMPKRRANLIEVLDDGLYDVVTIQQASHLSWRPESYHPYGDDLVALIRTYQPQAKIYVQETWSYTPWDRRLKNWGLDQDDMYDRLHKAYADFAGKYGFTIIPMGTAVQEWRSRLPVKYTDHSFGGDVVGGRFQRPEDHFKRDLENNWIANTDVFHLNERGEYFQALVWTARIFGKDVTKCEYRPGYVKESEAKLMKEIANEYK